MKIHYKKDLKSPDKIIDNVIYVGVIDGNEPVSVVFENGKELNIRLDRIEAIIDDSLTEQPNAPLTLDELRQMNGEPVWVIDGENHSCYVVVNTKNEDCIDNESGAWCFEFCGMEGDGTLGLHKMGWIAYRRKPERTT